MKQNQFKNRLLASSVIAGLACTGMTVSAAAQDDEGATAVQEKVVVTGSRIAKQDFVSNSPIATVDAETFMLTGSVNTEDVLNTLPQVIPAFDRTSNNPGDGTATVDLRGLGISRSLVLLDGRRMVPSDDAGAVDLNTIPASIIERVEVITGGASAIYGSDAMAGVVNFVLKKDFEGFEANIGYEQTLEHGDAEYYTLDMTFGANFDGGRGNIVTNLAYTDRAGLFASAREFARVIPGGGGSSGVPDGHSFATINFTATGQVAAPTYTITPRTPDAKNVATFTVKPSDCALAGTSPIDPDGSLNPLNADGTARQPATSGDEFCGGQAIFAGPDGIRPWINSGDNSDRYNYAPVNYLQLPQERFTAMTVAHYEVNKHLKLYGRFNLAVNQVPQQLAATPAFQDVTTALSNPFLNDKMRTAFTDLANRQIATAQKRLDDLDRANFDTDKEFQDAQTAAQSNLNTVKGRNDTDADGTVDAVQMFIGRRMLETGGRVSNDDRLAFQFQFGARGAVTDSIDYDTYFQIGRTQNNNDLEGDISLSRYLQAFNVKADDAGNAVCVDASGGCVPMNLFGAGSISAEAANFVRMRLNSKSEYDQIVAGVSFNGDTAGFLELPGGPIGWAAGGEYREESFDFRPSDALATGNMLGFNAAPPRSGSFDVYDVFVEFYAPILKDTEFAEILAVEGALRSSDYSTVGRTEAWKLGAEYAPIEGLRFRTQYNTAIRAPSINESFAPQSNGFPTAQDPCSTTNRPVENGIRDLCIATGVPAALVGDTPEGDPANPAFYQQRNSQIESLYGGENPNLKQEEAETFTIGAVWQPDFVDGLSLSVDYYDIQITGYISTLGGGTQGTLDQCYGSDFNPTKDANNVFCKALNRNTSTGEAEPRIPNSNSGALNTSGIDVLANYDFELSSVPGSFSLAYSALFLSKWELQTVPGGPFRECNGRYGAFCGDPIAEYKHNAVLGWNMDPYSVQLRWEYLDSVKTDALPGASQGPELDAINYFNLNGTWEINDNLMLSGGIDNLLDQEPALQIPDDFAQQSNTYPATYDLFGRTVYMNLKLRF